MKNKKSKKENLNVLLIVVFIGLILALAIGFYIGLSFLEESKEEKGSLYLKIQEDQNSLIIPAVDSSGEGVHGELITNIREGSGLVLVNINDVLAGVNTQNSARVAARAARAHTNISLENIDVIFNIKVDADFIEGPSAGSAMAISLIALLENKNLNNEVGISGSINEEGIIGPASGIEKKAEALKEKGINLFLISDQTMFEGEVIKKRSCIELNAKQYCEIIYTPDVKTTSELEIKRVKNLNQAMEYFYEK